MDAGNPGAVSADPSSEDERTLVLQRVFDVPAQFVFEAHARPEHVIQWFGPAGYPLALCEMDFRVGGRFRFAMQDPKGELMAPFGGEYLEIVQDKTIRYTNGFEAPDSPRMVVTLLFHEQDGQTTLTMRTVFSTIGDKQSHVEQGMEEGVKSGFDQLREVAHKLAVTAGVKPA